MKICMFFYALMFGCNALVTNITTFDSSAQYVPLTNAIIDVINSRFLNRTTSLDIRAFCSNPKHQTVQNEIIGEILHRSNGDISFVNMAVGFGNHPSSKYQLIFMDKFKTLSEMIINAAKDDGHILIVVIDQSSEAETIVSRVFDGFWTTNITNVYAMTLSRSNDILLHTFYPYAEGNCGHVKPEIINTYHNGKFTKELRIFEDKLRNMHQCPLVVLTTNFPPYNVIRRRENGRLYLEGRDGELVNYIASSLNFDVAIYNLHPNEFTRANVEQMLNNNTVHIVMGLLDVPKFRANFSVSLPYFMGRVGIILPPGIPLASAEKLTIPFTAGVWIGIVVVFIASIAMGVFSFDRQAFTYTELFVTGGLREMSTRNSERFMIAPVLISLLILQNSYQGALFDILRAQVKHQPIKTVDDLATFNYSISCPELIGQIIRTIHPKLSKNAIRSSNPTSYEKLFIADRNVYLSSESEVKLFTQMHPDKKSLELSREALAFILVAFNFKKGSALAKPMNREIERAQSSGLPSHSMNKHVGDFDRRFESKDHPEPLTMDDLSGIFYMCGVLYFIAFLVVIVETFIWNLSNI